jgi:hypothetical protein
LDSLTVPCRHGLYLNVLEPAGPCSWRFMKTVARQYAGRDVHVVLDNFSTHSTPDFRDWLAKHPDIHFHFTPTFGRGSTRWRLDLESSPDRPSAAAPSPVAEFNRNVYDMI